MTTLYMVTDEKEKPTIAIVKRMEAFSITKALSPVVLGLHCIEDGRYGDCKMMVRRKIEGISVDACMGAIRHFREKYHDLRFTSASGSLSHWVRYIPGMEEGLGPAPMLVERCSPPTEDETCHACGLTPNQRAAGKYGWSRKQ